jgi:hypothetical protein
VRRAAIFRNAALVLQHEADLNDARQSGSHKRVAEHSVCHGADHEFLWMRRHCPARHQDDEARNEVALRLAIPAPAKPDARQSCAPPDDAHGSVLPVIPDPGRAPAVLGESVDAAPGGDNDAVKELLAPAGPTQPELADQQQEGEQDRVRDKGTAHDKVRQALAEVVALAKP